MATNFVNETLPAAMARRSKEAIRRASASTKPSAPRPECPVDVSVSFRSVAVEVVPSENDSSARPRRPAWEAFRTATSRMHSHPNFGLTQAHVLPDAKRMSQARTNSLSRPERSPGSSRC